MTSLSADARSALGWFTEPCLVLWADRGAVSGRVFVEALTLEGRATDGWIDHYDADGRPIAADIPASTGYHLAGAVAELVRTAKVLDDASSRSHSSASRHAD